MAGFIEEFYYGNIDPQTRGTKPNANIKKEMQTLTDCEEELTKILTGEEKKKFLDYLFIRCKIKSGCHALRQRR